MKTYYEAFDGTRFDDEDECMDYENGLKAKESGGLDGIVCCTDNKIRTPKDWNTLLCYLDYSEYLYFKNEEALDLCLKACAYNGTYFTGLTSTNTLYKWESRDGKYCWVPIIETFKTEVAKMLDLERDMTTFKN